MEESDELEVSDNEFGFDAESVFHKTIMQTNYIKDNFPMLLALQHVEEEDGTRSIDVAVIDNTGTTYTPGELSDPTHYFSVLFLIAMGAKFCIENMPGLMRHYSSYEFYKRDDDVMDFIAAKQGH